MEVHLARGTRDLLPEQMHRRNWVIGVVKRVFERFGFEPLETPAIERIETLTGKYGEEGEQLIYKVLERGEGGKEGKADLALRYDLTVPLARVMAMNQGIPLPFKRYQIQPVWRADRPQKGRFREFYQCDVDTVGSHELLADAECLAVVDTALRELGFQYFRIRLNHRKILRGIVEAAGVPERETTVLVGIDKLDKIGPEGVTKELVAKGIPAEAVEKVLSLIQEDLDGLADLLPDRAPVEELRQVLAYAADLGVQNVAFDATLARGLNYYTGPVFETEVLEPKIGSLSGGGRYDGLIGMFSGKPVPSVGVSLGLERIITVMDELGMLPGRDGVTEVMVTIFDENTRSASLRAASALRDAGVHTQLWLGAPGKLGKQFKRANELGARFALVIGPDEARNGTVALKLLDSGEQKTMSLDEAIQRVKGP